MVNTAERNMDRDILERSRKLAITVTKAQLEVAEPQPRNAEPVYTSFYKFSLQNGGMYIAKGVDEADAFLRGAELITYGESTASRTVLAELQKVLYISSEAFDSKFVPITEQV